MHIQIRQSDQTDDLATYRQRQREAFVRRNWSRLRDEFWERKRRDHEAGERWLAENAPEEVAATIAAR